MAVQRFSLSGYPLVSRKTYLVDYRPVDAMSGGSLSFLYRSMAGCKIYLPEAKEAINTFLLQYFLLQRTEPDKSNNPFQHTGDTDRPPNADNP